MRDATAGDVSDVLRLRAASWRAAYAGIMPPAYLDAMNTDPGELTRALRRFEQNPAGRHCLLAQREGRSIAFVMCGPERPMPEQLRTGERRGEVYALYAHPDAWSTGAGAALLTAARRRLLADGFGQHVLWVLEANARGRAFYERRGMHPTGRCGVLRLGGAALTELEYAATAPVPAPMGPGGAQPGVVAPRRSAALGSAAGATPGRRGA
ncbi:GNAT family N-acetyltransferase [Streptacidiphilus sp. PB12-B1b]|uniref:GNAT family N-acetyltransferase n=1 Tax=Streptacidiphilus sp. PB12-B1b TaxID=2705012 RepID=UPI0015FB7F6C|nr:GNAT family N-acetyltransferase [Streptacidiphilus sp. PB12-B1b]QMU78783.1 GNAT family N-acetyltransferase [Streptacidiphilus sp. PB12-B1b]